MKRSHHVPDGSREPPPDSGASLPGAGLRHDCAVYFRDLAMATLIFLPAWALLYLLRALVISA